ncbi:MAG: hypothetical protein QOG47_739 [Mycobacterium sp.]|nr:hypothetical protein [Mycobacterium sp.]
MSAVVSTRGNDSTRLPSNVLSLPHRSVHLRRRTRQRRDRAAGLITIAAGGGQIVAQCATPFANVMRFSLKSPCQIDCIINALDDVRRHGRIEYVVVHGVTPSRVLHPGCDGARWLIRPLWLSAAAQDVDPIAAAAFDRYVGDTPRHMLKQVTTLTAVRGRGWGGPTTGTREPSWHRGSPRHLVRAGRYS